jgi:hypothetical protein
LRVTPVSVEAVARWAALVLTLVVATLCLLVALAIAIIGLGAGQYYKAMGAGVVITLAGGLPPLLTAVVLGLNARLLKRGVAGVGAKGVACVAALLMAVCAFVAVKNHLGGLFVFLFLLTASLLASPLALRSPEAAKPPKS